MRSQLGKIPKKMSEIFGSFLGESGNEEKDIPPSINTRISSGEEMRTFILHDFLGKNGVENSKKFHKSLSEHGISKRGRGRQEVVAALTGVPQVSTSRDLPQGGEMSKGEK